MLSTVVLLVTLTFLVFVQWYINLRHYKYLNRFPSPPIFALIRDIVKANRTKHMLPLLKTWLSTYGRIVKIRLGVGPYGLLIDDLDFVERLLGSNKVLEKAGNYKFLHRWLGTGLLTSKGEKWRRHRKILTPAFHFKILEQFPDTFDSAANILVDKLYLEYGKNSIDIYPLITLCSLDIICETAMGTSINAQKDSDSLYVRSVKEMCRIITDRSMSPIKVHKLMYLLSRDYRKELSALKVLHNFTNTVIEKRKLEIDLRGEAFFETDEFGRKKKATLLDLLLQYRIHGQDMSDEEISEEVNTFMFEGHDTTASAMSFAIYNIAHHIDVQNKIVQELEVIFGNDRERPANYTDLQNMKYLEAVLKETLRLYPSVPVYGRNSGKGIELDGTYLPYDLNLIISAYTLHRRPELFSDPEKFDPERFMVDLHIPTYAYIPFSAGPRNCIGQRFAMLEMKSVVSKILRNFVLFPVPEHVLKPFATIVLKSTSGMCVRLKPRYL